MLGETSKGNHQGSLFLPRIELTSILIGAWYFENAFSPLTGGNPNATILIHISTDVFGGGP